MALVHYFLPISLDEIIPLAKYQQKFITNGSMMRFTSFLDVSNVSKSDITADTAAGKLLMNFYKRNRDDALSVADKHILKNLLDFQPVETFFSGYIPFMGLNYYGFTLIPWESLPMFISVLNTNSVQGCYRKLISLCEEAYNKKQVVLHCGI